MSLSITTDGTQDVVDATGSVGVAYLSGVAGGAQVTLGVRMTNTVIVPLEGSKLVKGSNTITHGANADLVAITLGATGTTALTLDFLVV